ncbi:VOC family protein [Spirilliplanes yamanashiensis]|uniref:VOC family protein n=1 Tax=Spirilliplanes yamanashiensis TaxID=42233 RepID=A0A8J4DJE0_9ACTN|nr:VOC family protein [Spirilliplanes yamanashiensis]MDP9817452.1 PhnB protein [Spirilliplanes yamanashiensis]GIJ02895.1 VOC family protein [Spirilliplanes yamanashiensis]
MSVTLNPYISFDGDGRAALEFYHSVFGGELRASTFGEYGVTEEGVAGKLMHGQLTTPDGFTLMVADTPPGMPYEPGTAITVSLSGDEEDKLRGWWDALSASGTVTMPLEKQMWGDVYGACKDRFGVDWMVNIAQG